MEPAALEQVLRAERGRLLAALIARIGDFQRAEDALQEASASALVHWRRAGPPDRPVAWLLRTALRKAIDGFRRDSTAGRHRAAMEVLAAEEAADPDPEDIPDDRLRLIFTCCHPALEPKTRVALTLRAVCGLTTGQIAALYLDAEPAMGQRLSRARAKIAAAGIPYAVPEPDLWPGRLNGVLTVIYLIFTAGHAAGPEAGADLCAEAIHLARMLDGLRPSEPEIEGALALLLLTEARSAARTGPDGATVPPDRQDRSLWNRARLAEGRQVMHRAMARRAPGPFQVKAAIAALNAPEAGMDWPQIAALYSRLMEWEPTPVVRLNRAVALARAGSLDQAAADITALADELDGFQPFHAVRADLRLRQGRGPESLADFDRAIALAPSAADALFLRSRRAAAISSAAVARPGGRSEKKGRAEARPKSNREV
jgi:RNA polymerase sigma-70 factor (ECF subfamily)